MPSTMPLGICRDTFHVVHSAFLHAKWSMKPPNQRQVLPSNPSLFSLHNEDPPLQQASLGNCNLQVSAPCSMTDELVASEPQ